MYHNMAVKLETKQVQCTTWQADVKESSHQILHCDGILNGTSAVTSGNDYHCGLVRHLKSDLAQLFDRCSPCYTAVAIPASR